MKHCLLVTHCTLTHTHYTVSHCIHRSLEKGDRQPVRVDSGEGTDGDVGHAVSCLYFVGDVESDKNSSSEVNRSGSLRLRNVSDNTSSLIEVKRDRLVCWRSKDVENERLEVLGESENLFVIQLWLHGCITTRENIMESIGRLKYQYLQKMLSPCGKPPKKEDD